MVETPGMTLTAETRSLLDRTMDGLDYTALGEIYCDEGGDAFWADRRPVVVELGTAWAAELERRLPRGGRSLYVGAGVAELPALLMEVVQLDRSCTTTSLRSRECACINAALHGAGLGDRLEFTVGDAAEIAGSDAFDHLSLVSVLDDPETFPLVSALTYGRASPLDFDAAAFEDERRRVRELVARLLARLQPAALVTTTVEEVPWILERAAESGWSSEADDTMVDTALVGDPIGFLKLDAQEAAR